MVPAVTSARAHRSVGGRDAAIVAVSLAVGACLYPLMLVPALGGRVGGARAVALLAGFAVICVAQVLRRRAPVPAIAAGTGVMVLDAALGPSLPVWLVFADLLYAAALYGPARLSRAMVPVATGAAGLVVLTLVLVTPAWQDGVTSALGAIPLALVPVAWARNVRQHQELTAAERRAADQAARIAELDRDAALHDERSRIARDLHDVVAGHVSSIALQATAATALAAAADPARMTAAMGQVRASSVQALDEMRAMIDVLSAPESGPAPADDTPGRLSDLPLLVEGARAGGLAVALHACPLPEGFSGAVELSAYRIAQEALTNAARHAPTGRATLTVGTRGPRLVIEMSNDRSPGTDASGAGADGGRGLLTMREWAAAVGGSCVAGPEGDLWRVRAELPRHLG